MTDTDYIATTGERWAPSEYGTLCVFGPGGRSIRSSEIIAELRAREDHARRLFEALSEVMECVRPQWFGLVFDDAQAVLDELRASYGGTT